MWRRQVAPLSSVLRPAASPCILSSTSSSPMLVHQTSRCLSTWVADQAKSSSLTATQAFDKAVHEYVGFYGDPLAAIKKSLANDPKMGMSNLFLAAMDLFSTGTPLHSLSVLNCIENAKRALSSPREKKHVEALEVWVRHNNMRAATDIWEDILKEYPEDELAVKFAHDAYFFLGQSRNIHDSIDRILPVWKKAKDRGMIGVCLGMHAFGLEETGRYAAAETAGAEALEINKKDVWALHALAHVHEMKGTQKEGREFLRSWQKDWEDNALLGCHIWWHWCLYDIELGDYGSPLEKFDSHLLPMAQKSGAMLDLVDVGALLQRLEFEGVNVGDRWKKLYDIWEPHAFDNVLSFNDMHMAAVALGAGRDDTYEKMMSMMRGYTLAHDSRDHYREVCLRAGEGICDAFGSYKRGDYVASARRLLSLREQVHFIGGSHAQRDLVTQLLLRSLLRICDEEKRSQRNVAIGGFDSARQLTASLLAERKKAKPTSGITDRMLAKLA